MPLHKDETLNDLAENGNVAQFVSFRPGSGNTLKQTYCRVTGFSPNHSFLSVEQAVSALLQSSSDGSVNIRSYVPDSPRSKEFIYALKSVEDVTAALYRLANSELHLIVNETIDVSDGGVSGVIQGDVVEFAPDDTPRCVEKPGVASLPFSLALELFRIVYGFVPELEARPSTRIEFSIHPKPRGYRQTHTIVWERESNVPGNPRPSLTWPNRFSRHIGDKAFGLLIAHLLGARVPKTLVIGRRVAPFEFGEDTGSKEVWTRTCPAEPQPGLFTTVKGWIDPFKLVTNEDSEGTKLSSVICQTGVQAQYSGAAVVSSKGALLVEGRHGEGDRFMLGLAGPEHLPTLVISDVRQNFDLLFSQLGAVRFEWVFDGQRTWIVQLHRGATSTEAEVIVPGKASRWVKFDVGDGLESLRTLLEGLPNDSGVIVEGEVGLTSHVADLLRKARRPAKLNPRLQIELFPHTMN
jgi:hypothetical protein